MLRVFCSLTQGLFFGYRWYDQHQVAPLFPFGHGLSYTSFAYSDLLIKAGGAAPSDAATLAFALGNTGALAGAGACRVVTVTNNGEIFQLIVMHFLH